MALRLEDFGDLADPAPEPPPGPSPDWLAGFAEGREAGAADARARAEEEGAALSAALARTLEDAAWTYAEAREAVLASLGPLLSTLLDRLLPGFAAEALVPRLVEMALAAARTDASRPVAIHVAPARAAALRLALASAGAHATVESDPALGPDAARLGHGGRETSLDLAACLASLHEACAAVRPARSA